MDEQSIEYIKEHMVDSRYYSDFQTMITDYEYRQLVEEINKQGRVSE